MLPYSFRRAGALSLSYLSVSCLGLPLLCAFAFLPSTHGQNLLKDSSFEGPGNNLWGYEGCKFTEADFSTDSIHGGYSLRWPHINPLSDVPFDAPTSGLQQPRLVYHAVTATPGAQYTLSAYAKTDPNASFDGTIHFQIYDSNRQTRTLLLSSQIFDLTDSWQRYSYTFTLPAAQNSRYVVAVEFFADSADKVPYPNPPRSYGLVDAVQLEAGGLSAYTIPDAIEYGLLPRGDANAWTWGQDVVVDLYACNTGNGTVSKTVDYVVEDFFGRIVRSSSQALSLPSNTRVKSTLNLGSDLRGHFRILLYDNGVLRTEKLFSTLPPPKTVSGDDSIYGLDASFSEFALETAKRLGIKWLRPHDELSWEAIEPEDGVFKFPDYRVNLALGKGFNIYGMMYRTPEWAQPSGGNDKSYPNSLTSWSNYVYQTAFHFKGKIKDFEVYNEPCFQMNSAEYLSLVQQASGAAKKANSSAQVFGWSSQVNGPSGYCYADINDQLVPLMGVVSAHYYPSYSGTAGTNFYRTLTQHQQVAGRGVLPLWNTEGGAFGGGTFYKTKSDFDPKDTRNSHAADMAKTWAFHKAANVKLFYYWLNFPNEDQTPAWSTSFSLNEYDSSLKATAVGTAASAYFLDGGDVTFDRIVYDGSGANNLVTAYGFERGSSDHVVVAWVDRTDRAVYVTNPSAPATTRVYDMFGRVVQVFNAGQAVSIVLRTSPVYIEVVGFGGVVDKNYLKMGPVVPDNSILIDEVVSPIGGSTRVEIYGSEDATPGADELIYQTTIGSTTEIVYPWTAPAYVPNGNTVVALHLDNRSEFGENGTTVHDFSGKNRHGTLVSDGGTLSYGDEYGRLGGGFRSPGGTANKSIRVPNGGGFNAMNKLTIAVWTKLDAPIAANRLFALGNVSGFSLGGDSTAIAAKIRESGSDIIFQVSDGTISRQRWGSVNYPKGDGLYHHLAFVFDGAAADPEQRRLDIYLDGVKINGTLQAGTIPSQTKAVNAEDFYVGGWATGGTSEAFTGDFDEVIVEAQALSDTEVQNLSRLQSGKNYTWTIRTVGSSTNSTPPVTGPPGAVSGLTYTIAAAGQGASVGIAPSQSFYSPGQSVVLTATPDAGRTFAGWIGSTNSAANPLTLAISQDHQLTASTTGGGPAPFRILSVSAGATTVTLEWEAVAGSTYRVQYRDELAVGDWTNLGDAVLASGATASRSDTLVAGGHRFYRVVAGN